MRIVLPTAHKVAENDMTIQEGTQQAVASMSAGYPLQNTFFDLSDAARAQSWLRASLSTIGKSLVGPRFSFAKVEGFEDKATEEDLAVLRDFYGLGAPSREFTNYRDFFTTGAKLYATAVSLSLGGFAAWEIRRNALGFPISFDYIPGFVRPNVDSNGAFLKPAFIQTLSSHLSVTASWDDPDDIVFFARPDFGGMAFSSDLEALVNFALPSDMHAAMSWLSMHKNRNAPLDGYWEADPSMSDESFKELQRILKKRYSGSQGYGRSPLVSRGALSFKRIQRGEDEAPYLGGRDYARQEIAAVTGVPGSKLGVTSEMNRASSREAKRDFYETQVEPLQALIEEATYSQVHVRLLGISGWRLKFGNPAFVNEIEQASIDKTYISSGVWSPNEVRANQGRDKRKGGDKFSDPTRQNLGGRTPVAEPDVPDPAEDEDPVEGSEPEEPRPNEQAAIAELRKWKRFAIRGIGRKRRKFESDILPADLCSTVQELLDSLGNSTNAIDAIFYAAEALLNSEE